MLFDMCNRGILIILYPKTSILLKIYTENKTRYIFKTGSILGNNVLICFMEGGDTLTPDIKNYTLEVTVRLITCDHSNIGMFHPVQCPAPAPGSPLRDRDRARIR